MATGLLFLFVVLFFVFGWAPTVLVPVARWGLGGCTRAG